MVDFDEVNPNNKIEFLNASIKNMEELLFETEEGLRLAKERQITFVKTGEINTSQYEATTDMINELEKEFEMYKTKLKELRRERAEL
jgi:hypothetical protein